MTFSLYRCWRPMMAGLFVAYAAAAENPPRDPPRLNGVLVDGLPMVKTWVPAKFPAGLPSDVRNGAATIRIIVDAGGALTAVRVLYASKPAFGEAAFAAMKQWTFSPGVDGGNFVAMCVDVPFDFARDAKTKPSPVLPERMLPRRATRTAAALVDAPLGDYPRTLAGRGLGGTVVFRCTVDPEGKASMLRVLRASHADLVLAAAAAFPSWRFTPGKQGDLNVASELAGEVSYTDILTPSRQDVLAANGITAPDGSVPEAAPQPLLMVDPVWPYDALIKGEGGSATVAFTVAPNGYVSEVTVKEATQPAFGAALLAAVSSSRFEPAIVNGRGAEVQLLRRVDFKPVPLDAGDDDGLTRLVGLVRQDAIKGGQGLDGKLVPLYRIAPAKPLHAASGDKGDAVIEFVIDRDGRARLPKIVSASREEYGWAAATAISQWVFSAPTRGGKPTEHRVQLPVVF
jgi:TonB family protein